MGVGLWKATLSINSAAKGANRMEKSLFELLEIISEKAAEIMDQCAIRFEGVRECKKNEKSMLNSIGYVNGCEKSNGENRL